MTRPGAFWRDEDAWSHLRGLTPARIALGRAGAGLPTAALLAFQAAHAAARDAVHTPFDDEALHDRLLSAGVPALRAHSRAADRREYLQRPDLGRQLDPDDAARLGAAATEPAPDLVIVVGDGLSATATHAHALPVVERLLRSLPALGLCAGPVVLARQCRVALGDGIGEALRARQVLVLLGERPGLSSPDSLSGYLTWDPRPGRRDAQRNCVSNIRPAGGLGYDAASHTLLYLIREAHRRRLTGIALKDDSALEPSLCLPGPA